MKGKKISRKKDEVKIIGSKSLDYTFLDDDFLKLKYTNIGHKKDEDNSNNVVPKDSKINKDSDDKNNIAIIHILYIFVLLISIFI